MLKFGLKEEIISSICALAEKNGAEKVIIFGSRAKGNYKKLSDIDLAVIGGNEKAFALDLDEDVPTLLKFDVVRMSAPVQKELLKEIEKDGIVIYEKDQKI